MPVLAALCLAVLLASAAPVPMVAVPAAPVPMVTVPAAARSVASATRGPERFGIRALDERGRRQLRFMWAMASAESGGDHRERERSSGAYGRYQIRPQEWRAWARIYLGSAHARPTPRNQERVACAKFKALYRWLGDWRLVAYWWLNGSGLPPARVARWGPTSFRYVGFISRRIDVDLRRSMRLRSVISRPPRIDCALPRRR